MLRQFLFISVMTLIIINTISCTSETASISPTTQPVSEQVTPTQITTTPSQQQTSVSIAINNFTYIPPTIEITSGTKVTWTNNDSVAHTVTSNDKIFDSGNMPRNATFNFTFNNTGTYEYYCIPHPYMKGKIIIK